MFLVPGHIGICYLRCAGFQSEGVAFRLIICPHLPFGAQRSRLSRFKTRTRTRVPVGNRGGCALGTGCSGSHSSDHWQGLEVNACPNLGQRIPRVIVLLGPLMRYEQVSFDSASHLHFICPRFAGETTILPDQTKRRGFSRCRAVLWRFDRLSR